MKKEFLNDVKEFIKHSNLIENEYSEEAMEDAMRAWRWAYTHRNEANDYNYVLMIHKLLERRIEPSIAGKIRDCDVFIGGHRKFFISTQLLEEEISGMLKRSSFLKDKENEGWKKYHLEFEAIHPFVDGNGRTGRILMNIHRININLPILIIHKGAEQMEYYSWFEQ